MKIPEGEIVYLQRRRRDNNGDVFSWNSKVLRGIYPEAVQSMLHLFKSGFINTLRQENLIPDTRITNYRFTNYPLIIEHERIDPVIFPQEWTFSMLRDSALMLLRVARIARKYGLNMKDCHGLNVLFECNRPKYIDIGSFVLDNTRKKAWFSYEEFLRFYYYPLVLWRDGLDFVAKLSIFSGNLTPHHEYLLYKSILLRRFNRKLVQYLVRALFLPHNLLSSDKPAIYRKLSKRNYLVKRSVYLLKLILQGITPDRDLFHLEKKITSIKRHPIATDWKDYHSIITRKKERFDRIIQLTNRFCLDAKTAIDVGGNQGLFSRLLLERTRIRQVICQDSDEQAIDIGYNKNKKTHDRIIFVNYNFMAPIVKTTYPLPWERFKSDMVFALALLHHLTLSQGYHIDHVLQEIGRYSKKYVCIEFMPKGLWIRGGQVNIPTWYNLAWFEEHFSKYFHLIHSEQIGENYIVFLGKIMQ